MDLIFVAALVALAGLDLAALRWGRDTRRGHADGSPERRDWW
jgi:hypothetical protein